MLILKGEHNSAKVFATQIDSTTAQQIKAICNEDFLKDTTIRVMPDCHAGKGCTIGTTMTITDKIVPNLVGVDIACGVLVARLNKESIDLDALEESIRNFVPHGRNIRLQPLEKYLKHFDVTKLRCYDKISTERVNNSIGTLGAGNHFIECGVDLQGFVNIIIHCGSRNLGKEVADYYQKVAIKQLNIKKRSQLDAITKECVKNGNTGDIQAARESVISKFPPRELAYLEGQYFDDYVHDSKLVQRYAELNRLAILEMILVGMRLNPKQVVDYYFDTLHNYLDTKSMILRKGAISAKKGELVAIPLNRADGVLICKGKGCKDYNYSAPHGAGRVLSRGQAKRELNMDSYRERMKDIYSTTVNESTLDESPDVYKTPEHIVDNIGPTVDIINVIKPIYSFKSEE